MDDADIRPATRNDAPHVAALLDIAGHGIEIDEWTAAMDRDHSLLATARRFVLERTDQPYHYSRAHLLHVDGEVAGCLIGGIVGEDTHVGDLPFDYQVPLVRLETLIPGYWSILSVAVYPEFRGRGLARRLIAHAVTLARETGAKGLSLVVEDTNEGAIALYTGQGFREAARRPWLPYGTRRGPREWIMLTRPV